VTETQTKRSIEPVSMKLYDTDFQAFADALGGSFKRSPTAHREAETAKAHRG